MFDHPDDLGSNSDVGGVGQHLVPVGGVVDAERGVLTDGPDPMNRDAGSLVRLLHFLEQCATDAVSVPSNPTFSCVPSQNGLSPDCPHLHRYVGDSCGRGSDVAHASDSPSGERMIRLGVIGNFPETS